ncbi:B-cell receptor CD22-like [Colossoma macropomum]|uniref:B-cell receptor CD22-like n=1 Tax=Colossoma macropomum TaxID=42526 RepID=UPI001864EE48|nr:B-cell receptor CD22-like [Colossoma macropomum]
MVSLRVSLPLLILLMIVGAFGTKWSVKYNQQKICALKGSTVFMNGTYTHPDGLTVAEVSWVVDQAQNPSWPDMSKNPDYSGRVEYLSDQQKLVSLKLSDVLKKDEHEYCIRIKTNQEMQKYLGRPGVTLTVTELHVETPEEVTEGETADLTCKTTCSLTDPTFIWYKNGHPLTTKTIKNNQLHLQTVTSEDAGSYSCAVRGYQHLNSTAQNLRVRYSPKNISVSISPSGRIIEGSSMNLTCSSDANPPVKNYTWFKGSTSVRGGKIYNIPNITSEDSGEYTCQSRNDHGERNSTAVHLNVLYPPKSVSVSINPSGIILEGSSVTLTCSSDANPPVKIYTWFNGSLSAGPGKTYSIPNIRSEASGEYTCQSRNDHGERNSTAVHLNVLYPPKSVSVSISPSGSGQNYNIINITADHTGLYYCEAQNDHGAQRSAGVPVRDPPNNVSVSISPSGETVEGSSVTLTCSSDGNPPVKNYTWIKGSTSVGEGKTYSIPNIRSEDSGEYTCQSRNDHGERNSTAVQINVLYPPKSLSVSISPSGAIVEGRSVTLTCSSDANPPVKNYTWFKEGGTSPVGSGQNYSIISITAEHTGLYYCEAQNEHGAQRSAGVPVSFKERRPKRPQHPSTS